MKANRVLEALQALYPRLNTREVLMNVYNWSLTELYDNSNLEISTKDFMYLKEIMDQIAQNVPLARLTGRQFFWKDWFLVSPWTLDPRPETEYLVEYCLKHIPVPGTILDLGTGTGCLLLSLLREFPKATGTGIDISSNAIQNACYNANQLNLYPKFIVHDLRQNLPGEFDLIISNPPYVQTECSYSALFDPPLALWDQNYYQYIVQKRYLSRNGCFILEIPNYALAQLYEISQAQDLAISTEEIQDQIWLVIIRHK